MKPISELGLELIELEDQVLLVDNINVSESPYVLWKNKIYSNKIHSFTGVKYDECKRVISSTKQIEGLPLLVIEDEVDSIVESEFKIKHPSDETHWKKALWKDGYATAKETYKFTEEDLKKILEFWGERGRYDKEGFTCSFEKWWEQIGKNSIESLTKKELWIEVKKMPQSRFITTAMHKYQPKITEGKIKAVWK